MKTLDIRRRICDAPHDLADFLHTLPDDHPLQIALRTYSLALSLVLGPALLPLFTSRKARARGLSRILHVLKRELSLNSFASAMTVGVAGGVAIRNLWDWWEEWFERDGGNGTVDTVGKARGWLFSLKDSQKSFLSNIVSSSVAIAMLHSRRRHTTSARVEKPSPTLDLTLVVLVRALDCLVQLALFKPSESEHDLPMPLKEENMARRRKWTTRLDALVFWACSARIMWCFFYKPERLPHSYNKWIMTLANIDPRILAALRAIKNGNFSYRKGVSMPRDLVTSLSADLGFPPAWGDPAHLPAFGGPTANTAWKALNISNRHGLGGMPCEVVHSGVASSCTANTAIRALHAFAEAVALYLPVHVLPILLTRPRKLLEISNLIQTLQNVVRSATFLSTFVATVWYGVCLTRTLLLARLFPGVSHDFWDGSLGCTFVGSLLCGGSIWIERGRRRGEMALYVLPRAIRACISDKWVKSGQSSVRWAERLVFVLPLSAVLTAATHRPDTLRGLSKWALEFVINGPNAGFWKRRRLGTNAPPTPTPLTRESFPPTENVGSIGERAMHSH